MASRPARGGWIEIAQKGELLRLDVGPVPRGAGGLKSDGQITEVGEVTSRPARGGWIEIDETVATVSGGIVSRPARGGWIEMLFSTMSERTMESRPARGGWIEI